jgi:aspartate kinase
MKVIKVGGGCLKGMDNIGSIIELIARRGKGHIFVVSALNGITDHLIDSMSKALADEQNVAPALEAIRDEHIGVAGGMIAGAEHRKACINELDTAIAKLERLLYGLNFTKEITPRLHDTVASFGERFSAILLSGILRSRGVNAVCRMPQHIGLVTDGKFGDATADIKTIARNFRQTLRPLLKKHDITFIPGFYGISRAGDITTFGRGGTDYSAAVVTAGIEAELLEIWKDVDGFMSADPTQVPEAELIPLLSYGEAAELSYFGAKILHPRTVEPLRAKGVAIAIKNTLNPDADGTLISARSPMSRQVIKSVAYTRDIGILKVHASGVGARPGILAQVTTAISQNGINIKSVVTSQTCISLLLARKDLEAGRKVLSKLSPRPYRKVEKCDDVALVGIVGDGLLKRKGIAARCFTSVAQCGVNVEMISFGPSPSALYFLVQQDSLHAAVNAIHSTFFSNLRCAAP